MQRHTIVVCSCVLIALTMGTGSVGTATDDAVSASHQVGEAAGAALHDGCYVSGKPETKTKTVREYKEDRTATVVDPNGSRRYRRIPIEKKQIYRQYKDTAVVVNTSGQLMEEMFLVCILRPNTDTLKEIPANAYVVRLTPPAQGQKATHSVNATVWKPLFIPQFYLACFPKGSGSPLWVPLARRSGPKETKTSDAKADQDEAAARSRARLAGSYEAAGKVGKAREVYIELVRKYPNTTTAKTVRIKLNLSDADVANLAPASKPAAARPTIHFVNPVLAKAARDVVVAREEKAANAVAARRERVAELAAKERAVQEEAKRQAEQLRRNLADPKFVRDLLLQYGHAKVNADLCERKGDRLAGVQAQAAYAAYGEAVAWTDRAIELTKLLGVVEQQNPKVLADVLRKLLVDESVSRDVRIELAN